VQRFDFLNDDGRDATALMIKTRSQRMPKRALDEDSRRVSKIDPSPI
jgi:hypothetical protein